MRGMNRKKKTAAESISQFKIDFSFKREVFFIIAGALVGALTYIIPITVFAIEEGSPYYLTWIVFGHIAGVHSPISSIIVAGFMLHLLTATTIGIISGLFLYKTNILNISKPSNGLKFGLFVGFLVFAIFAIPVQEFVLRPEFARTINSDNNDNTASSEASTFGESVMSASSRAIINQLRAITNSLTSLI